jgi:uncharacterized membrane protein YkoI
MKTILALTMLLAAAGGVAAWALWQEDPGKLLQQTGYTLSAAIAKAVKEAKEGTPVLAELEEEDGKVVYSIEVAQGGKIVEVNLDAKTGELVKKDTENEDKSKVAQACSVPLSKAIETAVQKVRGQAFHAKAEIAEGKAQIEVKVLSEGKIQKVLVDGVTGDVLAVKTKKEEKEK